MLSLLIPFYNESNLIESFLTALLSRIQHPEYIQEIILIDGSSTDDTYKKAENRINQYSWEIRIQLIQSKKSRAIQQNAGAKIAIWKLLFFLHIDCLPQQWFEHTIYDAFLQWYQWGVCQFSRTPSTRYTCLIDSIYNTKRSYRCRFGDSWIIVSKKLFCAIGWFDEHRVIEEDHIFIMELWKRKQFVIYPINLFVSDRLFRANGFAKTLLTYILVHWLFLCWCSQNSLLYIVRTIKWVKS